MLKFLLRNQFYDPRGFSGLFLDDHAANNSVGRFGVMLEKIIVANIRYKDHEEEVIGVKVRRKVEENGGF